VTVLCYAELHITPVKIR